MIIHVAGQATAGLDTRKGISRGIADEGEANLVVGPRRLAVAAGAIGLCVSAYERESGLLVIESIQVNTLTQLSPARRRMAAGTVGAERSLVCVLMTGAAVIETKACVLHVVAAWRTDGRMAVRAGDLPMLSD